MSRSTVDLALLPQGTYNVILSDPPWQYYGDLNKDQAAGKHYQLMSLASLKQMPVANLMAPKAVHLMWTTSSQLANSIELLKAWGCHYRGVFQIWVKTTNDGKIISGQGARPSFTKPTTELLLIGSTKEKGRTLPIFSENMSQVVLAPRPDNVHSRKPEIFRQNIDKLFGSDVRKLELFARGHAHQGWDSFGNEVEEDDLIWL